MTNIYNCFTLKISLIPSRFFFSSMQVRIFQPPHKRLEDAEDRQRDLEQAFEDMYMLQTGLNSWFVKSNWFSII